MARNDARQAMGEQRQRSTGEHPSRDAAAFEAEPQSQNGSSGSTRGRRVPGALNWIDGSSRPAENGMTFHSSIDPAGATFPRSGAGDVDEALRAANAAAQKWATLGQKRRRSALDAFLDALGESHLDGLAQALDVSEQALFDQLDAALDEATDAARVDGSDVEASVCSIRWDWRALFDGLRQLIERFALGDAVLFFSDPTLPWIGATLAEASRDSLPSGLFNVLHDDRGSALRASLESGVVARVCMIGDAAERPGVESALKQARPAPGWGAPFGSGVFDQSAEGAHPQIQIRPVANRVRVIRAEDDPERAARRICDETLAAPTAFGGLRSGLVSRVLCHERLFSRFTEALLAALAAANLDARRGPTPAQLDAGLERHLQRARELGLDEGATLIWEGIPEPVGGDSGAVFEPGQPQPGSRGARSDVTVGATVFTNVEEHMQLARLRRPAPLLCLMRVSSDEEGKALAQRIDVVDE